MARVLLFTTRYPAPLRNSILNDIRFSDAASAVVFSDAIFKGMVQCGADFININNPPIGYWPKMNRRFRVKTKHCIENGRDVWNVGSTNLFVYQYLSIYHHTLKTIKEVLRGEPATCIVYAINVPIIRSILNYRIKYAPQTKIVLIIPDLIEDMYNGTTLKSILQRWIHGDIDAIYKQMDGFVYLTEQMREKTKSSKPYCIVEGIYDSTSDLFFEPNFSNNEKKVFYSGKLDAKFGVRNLVDAFSLIPDSDARLVLCGSGDCEEYIKQQSALDNRILFMGQITREDVLKLQSESRLLVNPRTPEGEFTRYSFPSKNIQYLASGIPTLMYQLEGIPAEYFQYCISITRDQLSVEQLSRTMQEALSMNEEQCSTMGQRARQFVMDNKNARIQSQKIIDLINDI